MATTTEQSFLGTGWSFPPAFDRATTQVEMISGEADVLQSLQIILSTRPGERFMQPDFGCDLSEFLFEEVRQSLITKLIGFALTNSSVDLRFYR